MNRYRLIVIILLISAVTISCNLNQFTPRGYLFSYGVNEYNVEVYDGLTNRYDLAPLGSPDDDAKAVYDMFLDHGYDSRLRLNGGGEVYNGVAAGPATLTTLLNDINFAAANAEAADTVVFYFAGHGGSLPSSPGEEVKEPLWSSDSDKVNDWFFLYTNSLSVAYPNLEGHFLSDDTLGTLLETIPRGKIIVIFDSCNSGGFIGDTNYIDPWEDPFYPSDPFEEHWDDIINEQQINAYTPPSIWDLISSYSHSLSGYDIAADAALVLAAAGELEDSQENSEHGFFTYYLLQTPVHGDINGDGYVSLFEMYEYTSLGVYNSMGYTSNGYRPRITASAVDFLLF